MKVLIEGWTAYPHSYVIVNINQILSLHRSGNVDIYIKEMPPFRETWQKENLKDIALFTDDEIDILERLQQKSTSNVNFDVVYRISYPYQCQSFINPNGTRPVHMVFYTAEFAELHERDFTDCSVSEFVEMSKKGEIIPVTPSNWSAHPLKRRGVQPIVIPHGICPKKLYYDPGSRTELRKVVGIPDDAFVYLHLGSMTGNKNIKAILLAFYRLSYIYDDTYLVLKGLGRLYASKPNVDAAIDALIKENSICSKRWKSLSNRCLFLDQVLSFDEMRSLYNMADVYVSPYIAEGFNIPVLESIACGIPVIVTDGGSTDDFTNKDVARYPKTSPWYQNLESGITDNYRVVNQTSLEEEMSKIVTDKDFRQSVTSVGPKWVADQFTWSHCADKLESVMTYYMNTKFKPHHRLVFDCRSASMDV